MNANFNTILDDIRGRYELQRIDDKLNPEAYATAQIVFTKIAGAICGKPYDTTQTAGIIKQLVHWSYNDSINGIDCKKGILLRGDTGRGKTLLMYALREFLQIDSHKYKIGGKEYGLALNIVSARNIAFEYAQQSDCDVIAKYSHIACLCIDDLGAEPMLSSNWGNKCSVVSEILANRCEKKLITFATTNVNKLSEKYDDRIVSRLFEQFNSITLQHDKDYRKI